MGCFRHLAIVNSAAMNIGVHMDHAFNSFGDIYIYISPEVELLGHMVILFLIF